MMVGETQGGTNHHVKVDNWPLFFLQRLHHFYRKKTHCDLTLLFPSFDSVKTVKVHKLVLHACTDYFESLDIKRDSEHGEVMVLSNEMQPDVIIPIIGFMYTGKLEFPVNLQPKLYEAAAKLRMTILMKLLDVQPGKGGKTYVKKETGMQEISTMEISQRSSDSNSPILIEEAPRITLKSVSAILQKPLGSESSVTKTTVVAPVVTPVVTPMVSATTDPLTVPVYSTVKPKMVRKTFSSPISTVTKSKTFENSLPPTLPGRKLPVWTRKIPSSPLVENRQNVKDYVEIPPRPTRFEWDEDLSDPTSIKPVEEATKVLSHDQPIKICQPIILENTTLESKETDDSLRRSFSDGSSSESPPYKRFRSDLQDMKEYGRQQQLRNEIICSEENMDDIMDTDDLYGTCEDDDIDDTEESSNFSPFNANSSTPKPILKTMSKPDPQTASKRVRFSLEGKENNQQENSSTGGDFAALMETESDVTSQKIVVPVSQIQDGKQHVKIVSEVLKKYPNLAKKDNIKLRVVSKNPAVPATVHRTAEGEGAAGSKPASSLVSYIFLTNKSSGDLMKPKTADAIAKEKMFDVENITGPWFCRVCNSSRPIQFDSYYNYRKHLVQVHEVKIDARICEYCGLRNSKRNLLLYHLYTKHGVEPPPNISFPKCGQCDYIALSDTLLAKHKSTHDPIELTCYTCNVVFKSYSSIQMHMKSIWHNNKANKGSLSDYPCPFCTIKFANGSELKDHIETSHHSQLEVSAGAEEASSVEAVEMQPSSELESLNNVASGIATSLNLQNDQAVVFYEDRIEDQELGRETTVVAENECKEFIVINPIEVATESGQNQEVESEVRTISIVNEDSNSRLSNAETNQSSCSDHDYSETQVQDGNREIISVQEVDGSSSSVIQKLLPDQGLVFANESDVVFESSCVGLPQRVILTSGNIVLPEGSAPQQGVILSQVLPQARIILTSPEILQQSGSIIDKGSTIVFDENGESMEGIAETVEYTAQTCEEVSKDEGGEKQEDEDTVIVLDSCEPAAENFSEKKDEGEIVEVEKKLVEENENVVSEEVEETNGVNQSVIKTVGETSKTKEPVVIVVDDDSTNQTSSNTIKVVKVKEETTEDSSDEKREEETAVKESTESKVGEEKEKESTKVTEEKKNEEETKLAEEEKEERTSVTEEKNKKDEETGIAEKKKEKETKTQEKKTEEERKTERKVETSQIVDDWDESNDSQPKIESRSDGPSRPDFF